MSEKCPYCGEEKWSHGRPGFKCRTIGMDQSDLCMERAALAETSKERDALQVQLRAWQTAFGTTQLTHALAKMEEAENAVKRSRTDLENAKADAESWHAQQDRFAAELIETSKQLERSRAKWARLREWANDHKVYANGLDFIDAMNRLDAEEKEEL